MLEVKKQLNYKKPTYQLDNSDNGKIYAYETGCGDCWYCNYSSCSVCNDYPPYVCT